MEGEGQDYDKMRKEHVRAPLIGEGEPQQALSRASLSGNERAIWCLISDVCFCFGSVGAPGTRSGSWPKGFGRDCSAREWGFTAAHSLGLFAVLAVISHRIYLGAAKSLRRVVCCQECGRKGSAVRDGGWRMADGGGGTRDGGGGWDSVDWDQSDERKATGTPQCRCSDSVAARVSGDVSLLWQGTLNSVV